MLAFSRHSPITNRRRRGAYTLLEVLIATPMAVMALGVVLTIAWAQMDMVGRNFATNIAHVNLLNPVQRLEYEVHMSVSEPELFSALSASGSYTAVSGTGPAIGVKLDLFLAGPFAIDSNVNSSGTNVVLERNGSTFQVQKGMSLCIPTYKTINGIPITRTIASVTNSESTVSLNLSEALGETIVTTGGTGGGFTGRQIVPVYISVPVFYYASGNMLIRKDGTDLAASPTGQEVVLGNLVTAKPFTKPDPGNGRFVGLSLSTCNPDYSARGYQSSSFKFEGIWIPSRGQLYP